MFVDPATCGDLPKADEHLNPTNPAVNPETRRPQRKRQVRDLTGLAKCYCDVVVRQEDREGGSVVQCANAGCETVWVSCRCS